MSLVDYLLQVSSAQAVTTTTTSTYSIDLSQPRDLGPGNDLYAMFTVDTTAAGVGASVTFQVISSASASLSSPTVLSDIPSIPVADLLAGRRPISLPIPQANLSAQALGQRYLGVQYTVNSGPLTAGAFSCAFVADTPSQNTYYPSGFTVA
ncbi:Bbp16 family capsid cement protein [Methylomonas sp. AM2-LC]|uniref:Bbp16 family capsid cement protein n=1 Tax=Methylomonas sp. AM2-LC TaxID=3153301 RepID=UPI0032638F0B